MSIFTFGYSIIHGFTKSPFGLVKFHCSSHKGLCIALYVCALLPTTSNSNSYILFLLSGRYDHFNDKRNECVLFRDEDYLPPTKEDDVSGIESLEDAEAVLNTKCPRCGKVGLY